MASWRDFNFNKAGDAIAAKVRFADTCERKVASRSFVETSNPVFRCL